MKKKQSDIVKKSSLYPLCLIIDKPEYKSQRRNSMEFVFALSLWFWWVSLWIPLVKIIVSSVGFVELDLLIYEKPLSNFIDNLFIFIYGKIFIILCVVTWSRINYLLYVKKNRRKRVLNTNMEKLAEKLGVYLEEISKIHKSKRIVYFFSEDDSLQKVELSSNDCK